jgi:periplasmic protein TonB
MSMAAARTTNARDRRALRSGLVFSGLVHLALVAVVIVLGLRHEPLRPPVYRVEMIGAPKGERQAGVVTPDAASATKAADAPSGAERAPVEKAMPAKKSPVAPAPKATPSPSKSKSAGAKAPVPAKSAKDLPKAGSGREGGKGADVRNVSLNGIAFPFPGYLTNIMRQVSIAYTPRRVSATLVAELKFLIRRDGSVAGIEIVKSSGDRLFDLEAQATVESVGVARSFGPLPAGWTDDVLVVYFTFDYALRPS